MNLFAGGSQWYQLVFSLRLVFPHVQYWVTWLAYDLTKLLYYKLVVLCFICQ